MRCIYCFEEKTENEFSQEHLIPRALGGNLQQNPFAISVTCKRCNSIAGWFVDAPFVRGQMMQMVRSVELQRFANIQRGETVPLIFNGKINGLELEKKICDSWLGPAGDQIYHFHESYPAAPFDPVRTGYPAGKDFDPGVVVVFLAATNPVWHQTIINSIREEFDKSVIYGGNFDASPIGLLPAPDNLKALIADFRVANKTLHCTTAISTVHDHRFLAKLSLGFGAKFLGEAFLNSQDASILRRFYREQSPDARELIPFRGVASLQKSRPEFQVFQWRRGHVVALFPGTHLVLLTSFFGLAPSATSLTADPALWTSIVPESGLVYVISPGLRKWVGPLSIAEFVAHQTSEMLMSSLTELASEEDSIPPLPSFNLKIEPPADPSSESRLPHS